MSGVTYWMIAFRAGVRLLAIAVVFALADLAYASRSRRQQIAGLTSRNPARTAFMHRSTELGHPVRDLRWVSLAAIAPVASCAVVLAEDEEFFDNGAVSWRSQRGLLQRAVRGDFSRGGSGIAQQLARNLFLSPARTLRRKAHEYMLAYQLSHTLSKARQLEIYLNVVEWGDGIWGIEAASRYYFSVAASGLSPAQGVVLASFLPAPRRELGYALGALAARRQEAIVRKLWRSRLLTDRDGQATLARVREWRAQTIASESAREGWRRVAALMGPEPPSFMASPASPGALPLARLCDVRRRGL